MRIRNGALASAITLALTAGLAACGAGDGTSAVVSDDAKVDSSNGLVIDGETIADKKTYEAAKKQTLTLYTSYQEANQKAFNDAFTADTGIEVKIVRDVTNKLSERIRSEAGAGRLPADVIITSDYAVADTFDKEGIWASYTPAPVKGQDGLLLNDAAFVKFANVVVTFAYNTQQVAKKDAPRSWKDLLDPKYSGKVGLVTGTAGGSSIALNRFIQEKVDPDYWKKLAELKPTIFDSGGERQQALARGELAVATAGTAAVNVAVTKDGAPIQYVVPKEGLVLFSFFAGKAATAKNPEAAKVFLNYALSKRGQKVISQVGDYSVRADVAPPVATGHKLPALDSDQVWLMPAEAEVKHGEADAEIWKTAFGR
ncbi:iron ABC transporter substrate-binding protein [Streptomyces sp. NTH33]|uniref:ABC transporter substrate-binding protein n=1 Tax=Streptomyces sp. NTH33 TaxID=1735453 RepID=UPI000DA79C35|nr:extracellular solute-binding protein [Streptomyces sp. NTH33]PZH20289.1 iron ABC transporter substrate-binding protein [Streptomyces sp. NTH33]